MRIHLAGAALLLATALSSCAMGPQHNVMIGVTPIFYVTEGDRAPPVIFEAGMGDGLESWEPVLTDVGATTTAMAYSRPGYTGDAFYKKEADGKRTGSDVARTLTRVLDKADVAPPYVLVGHSIGGTYALRFAQLHPDEVAGIVLVDARLKRFRPECEAADFNLCSPPSLAALALPDHVREEFRGLEETEAEAPEPDELGDIPITVIASTEPPFYASDDLQQLWLRVQREFASALSNGRFVQADGASHYVHRDDPELVIREIRDLVERIRLGTATVAARE